MGIEVTDVQLIVNFLHIYSRFLDFTVHVAMYIAHLSTIVNYWIRPCVSLSHTQTCSQTFMCFMSVIFVSNSLQEVPRMTSPFIGPSGSAVHLS